MNVQTGTCGFGISKPKYAELFPSVEVQLTFYQPPSIATLERWREQMPHEFEFTLKAWQLVTHEAKSPTYRRLKRKLSEVEQQEAGFFKPTAIVREAWDVTLACARALAAKTILFQCPASFKSTPENIANLNEFFAGASQTKKREKLNLAWEPRGEWDRKLVKEICRVNGLWHVVDPFKDRTVTPANCYFRLHGRNGWRYKYEEGELRELVGMLPANGRSKKSYVFFNNVRMTEDAVKFQEIWRSRLLPE